MDVSTVHGALLQQALWCDAWRAPFTAALCRAMAEDYARGGIIADLTHEWPSHPIRDALSLRLTGALHYCALKDPDSELAKAWPRPSNDWSIEVAWPLAEATLRAKADWAKAFIQSPPQTNEVGRSVGLWPGLCAAAQAYDGPIDILELGASGGLNLVMDHFTYQNEVWSWPNELAQGRVNLSTEWSGTAPFMPPKSLIRHRAACDQNPLNANDPEHCLRLKAYVWPEQFERLARLDAALKLVREKGLVPDQADASNWLAEKLVERKENALTVVYHSVFLQYPPQPIREAIEETMQKHGVAATLKTPLAWLRFEPPNLLGYSDSEASHVVELLEWPSNRRRLLASIDPHGRSVRWLGA
jgi:hypothetical protein